MDWDKYFEMLSNWKKLPAYRAEPRVDSLIGYYLKNIVADYIGEEIKGSFQNCRYDLRLLGQNFRIKNMPTDLLR